MPAYSCGQVHFCDFACDHLAFLLLGFSDYACLETVANSASQSGHVLLHQMFHIVLGYKKNLLEMNFRHCWWEQPCSVCIGVVRLARSVLK